MAGPTLRAMLKPNPLRRTAPGTSARGNMSPTEACHAGAMKAMPHPIRKVNSSSNQGVINPAHAHTASAIDTISMKTCATIMTLRRSTLSAIAPAASASSTMGRATDV